MVTRNQLARYVVTNGVDAAHTIVAKGFVAVAEMDFDLRRWRESLVANRGRVEYHANVYRWRRAS